MKKLLLAIICCILCVSYSANAMEYQIDEKRLKEIMEGVSLAVSETYDEHGKLEGRWSCKSNEKNKILRDFDENGNLMTECFKTNDKYTVKLYSIYGRLWGEGYSEKGGRVSKKTYYDNGDLKSDRNFVNGNGLTRIYYKMGNLRAEIPYKNGEIDGIKMWYYENGNLESETPYKNGKREGIRKDYGKNGKLKAEQPFKNDKLDGVLKQYYDNGNLLRESTFKNGKQEFQREYYENGALKEEMFISEGKAISGYIYDINGTKKKMTNAHLYNKYNIFENLK